MGKRTRFPTIQNHRLITLFLLLWLVFSAQALHAISPRQEDRVPAALLRWSEKGPSHIVLVDKSAQKIFLYNRNKISTPERVFTCSTGENEGPKTKQDDKKTPEGIYFFTHSYLEEDLAPIYGVRAFPINYPNVVDQKEGRHGYGIWFHGLNKPLKPRDTNGCIALDNSDIEELASYIHLYKTPIIISSKLDMVHPLQLEQERRTFGAIIEGWKRAWEEKDIEAYISFYHKDFTGNRMNRQQWKYYKAMLTKRYKRIRVEVRDLQLLSNDGLVLAIFTQKYKGDGFESLGEKELYFKKNSDEWKIFGEFFRGKARKIVPKEEPKEIMVSTLDEVKEFISLWRSAWERQDLDVYVACYDQAFTSRGMDLEAWREYKRGLNEKYQFITVDIQDMVITPKSDRTARVGFKQAFQADDYHDYGMKKMYLTKEDEQWKIKSEIWMPLKKTSNPSK
jgi:murein L,D-transpeptidase YafK